LLTSGSIDIFKNILKDKSRKILTITNGFDPEDFPENLPAVKKNDKFALVYTGTVYSYRYPLLEAFINALGALLMEVPDIKNKIIVKFTGEVRVCKKDAAKLTMLMQKFDLHNAVFFEKQVSHKESLQLQREADVLLLLTHEGRDSKTVFTGKIFEYLASGRTIFAITPDSPAKDLIQNANAGITVRPEDREGIKKCILELYQRWNSPGLAISPRWEVINELNCKKLTGKLAGLLNQIILPCGGSQ